MYVSLCFVTRYIEKGCLTTSPIIQHTLYAWQYRRYGSVLPVHLYAGNLDIDVRYFKSCHILYSIFNLVLYFLQLRP